MGNSLRCRKLIRIACTLYGAIEFQESSKLCSFHVEDGKLGTM